jgi:hypothetical protein
MLLFGHIGITLGIFFGLAFFFPRLRSLIDPKYLAIGSLIPDLVDKPIGRVIFASSLANGRIIGHTLLFCFLLLLVGLYLYDKKRGIRILALASGSFFHLFEDKMWAQPRTFFWPSLGLNFPKDHTDYTGFEYLSKMLELSFQHGLSQNHIPEIIGVGITVLMTFYWLKRKLIKKDPDNVEKPVN